MTSRALSSCRRLLSFSFLFLSLVAPVRAVMIDQNGNGMSDIWELIYGANALDPNADTDGDGVINILEAIAGTDPLDPNSVPKISFSAVAGTNFVVNIAAALGKQYVLESAQPSNGGWTNWTPEASVVARSGSVVTLTSPSSDSVKFYRISISDVDTDGDGVNDWEEYQLGLDPMNATSNGTLDSNGKPLSDYAYVLGKLANENVVTITATDPTANQPDPGQNAINFGMWTVTRGGFPLNGLLVNLGLASPGPGIAIEGVDHAPVYRSVFFPPGSSS